MARRDEIVSYLDEILEVSTFRDYGPNGLQVQGKEEVQRVAVAVSANLETFEKAVAWGADMVLVHHGLFWDRGKKTLTSYMYRRVKALMDGDVNLVAYHLPLDAHMELGNNAQIAGKLGLEALEPWDGPGSSKPIGIRGRFAGPLDAETFFERARELFGEQTLVLPHGPRRVLRGAVISGGGAYGIDVAAEEGLDFFVSGEAKEPALGLCREMGIHFVAGGHYASERLGVQALAKKLRAHFAVETEFIDVPNPL